MSNQMPIAKNESSVEAKASAEISAPEIANADKDVDNSVNLNLTPSAGIEVVADRKGFYGQRRIAQGEKFFVKSMDKVGRWMTCIDPVFEKQRKVKFKLIKAK